MASSSYELATSGFNPDRFVDDLVEESAVVKIKEKFWTAKQIVCDKLGLFQDEDGPVESDREFIAILTRFDGIRWSTTRLLSILKNYTKFVSDSVNSEHEVCEILNERSRREEEHLKISMKATASALSIMANQRIKIAMPLARIHHELEMFNERAVADCLSTAESAKHSQAEYRGSLLWMRSIKELDPERSHDRQMGEFRTAQQIFKKTKKRFDQLNEDLVYKVDLLARSRSKLLVDLLKGYVGALLAFYEDSSKELDALVSELPSANTYELDILKLINQEIGVKSKGPTNDRPEKEEISHDGSPDKDEVINIEKLVELLEEDATSSAEALRKEFMEIEIGPSSSNSKFDPPESTSQFNLIDFGNHL